MAKQDRAIRTREAVLRAAGEAFGANGFLGTSMADVFEGAGVTKGALYFHFSSKEDLVRALVEAEEVKAAEICGEELARGEGPIRTLVALTGRWVEAIRFDPIVQGGVRLLVERALYDLPMIEPYSRWEIVVSDLLRRSYEEGGLCPGVEPQAAAEFVVASFTGVQFVSWLSSAHQDLQERIDMMWRLVLPGLLCDGGRTLLAGGAQA